METHKIDKIVRESLKSKTIQPSNSAWERLSDKLDAIPQKKDKKKLLYIGYVASVFLLISVVFLINTDDEIIQTNPNEIVVQPIDTSVFKQQDFIKTIPIEKAVAEVEIKKRGKRIEKRKEKKETVLQDSNQYSVVSIQLSSGNQQVGKRKEPRIKSQDIPTSNLQIIISKTQQPTTINQQLTANKIKVDSDRLLFAVTHTEEEVKPYYAKYNVNRSKMLEAIEEELKKTKLKIDAKTILAEVERAIGEDTFKRDFLEVVKGKIIGLAVAFSNRNN